MACCFAGALLCSLLASFPIHWVVVLIQYFGKAGDDAIVSINGKLPIAAIPPEVLEQFGYTFFVPLIVITIGASIAPKFKCLTGVALAVLWGIKFGASITLAITGGQLSDSTGLSFAVSCLLAIAGVTSGLYLTYKSDKPEAKKSEDN